MRVVAILVTILAVSLAAPSGPGFYSEEADASKKVEKFSLEGPLLQDENISLKKEVETQEVPEVVAVDDEEKNDANEAPYRKPTIDDYRDLCRTSNGVSYGEVAIFGEKLGDDAPQEMKCYVQCIQEYLEDKREKIMKKYNDIFWKTIEVVDETRDQAAKLKICENIGWKIQEPALLV
ncbi:uncharacterized protein LOC124413657 [Diprion similis]|uniref:uncharacterized protein LOC124413657 n=1 Tax=Diprion similis TaxID=362088 RepID=UPI001EF753F5|nr:uncharacterized protein LOC124413657 [Diprion similis]